MKNLEKITVCIPTYNRASTLSSSIKSLLVQSYENIEILVIDNASTDNTEEVVNSFRDMRIKYIYFKEHVGVNYNFLRAIFNSETEIVCVFHSDDYYFPDIIKIQYQYIILPGVGAVFSKMKPVNLDKDKFDGFKIPQTPTYYEVIRYNYKEFLERALSTGIPVNCPTLMTRKSIIEKTGLFSMTDGLISDLSLWLPIAKQSDIIDLQVPLMFYGMSKDQLSYKIHNKRITQSPQFLVLDEILDSIVPELYEDSIYLYKIRKSKDLLHIGKNCILSLKFLKGVKYIFNGCIILLTSRTMKKG